MARQIFDYSDYRKYLREHIAELPKRGRGEIGKLAKHLRVSQTLVSQILMGIKQLSLEQAEATSRYLGQNNTEREYFLYLIQLDRSGTHELKKFWSDRLDEVRVRSKKVASRLSPKKVLTEQERSIFYSSPLYSAVRLFTSTADEGKSLEQIAERFEISREKASNIISFLLETSLLVESNGLYKMGAQSTHLESGSPHLLRHRANWRLKALQYSEVIDDSELLYSAPVSLSREDFDKLREQMLGFIKDFLKTVHDSPAEEIACLNMDFFWIRK